MSTKLEEGELEKLTSGVTSFEAEGRLLQELGERLVASPEVALVELIKNSYDADASSCDVNVLDDGRLEVADTGSGMTLEQFQQRWMRIATTHKLLEPTSPRYHRKRTGQKGIGRFAVRFLGKTLQLTTVAFDDARKKTTKLIADFDWEDIDSAKQLTAAKVKYTLWSVDAETPEGTTLRIGDLRHNTDFLSSKEFQTSVLRIVSPLESLDRGRFATARTGKGERDPGFRAQLPGGGDSLAAVDLAGALLDRAWATLTIDAKGNDVIFSVTITDVEKPFVLRKSYKNSISKGLHADIRFFPRRAGVFRGSGVDGRKAWTWVRENCGVAIVDHGFRIRPYGFENDDWLILDSDAVHNRRDWRSSIALKHFPIAPEIRARPGDNPALNLPTMYQLVGAVFVESIAARRRVADDLIPSMDREGFLQNEAFSQLVDVVRAGIEFLALVDKNELTRKQEKKANEAAKAVRSDFRHAIESIRESETLSAGDKSRLVEHYSGLAAKLEEVEEYGRDARRKLEVMGLLGVVAGFMTHEAVRILEGLDQCIKSLEPLVKKYPDLESPLGTVQQGYRVFKGHVDYTSMFVDAMHRGDAKPFKAAPQVRRIIERFGEFASDRGIIVANELASDLYAPAVPISVYSGVLLNLYTNALKSVLAVKQLSKPPHVTFRGWNEGGRHIIEVLDRGVGVPEELRRRVFDPLFTTTSNIKNPLGSGMGLGLSLVKEVMTHMGGKISIVNAPKPYSTCFKVEFGGVK